MANIIIGTYVTNNCDGLGVTTYGESRDASSLNTSFLIEQIIGPLKKGRGGFVFSDNVNPETIPQIEAALSPNQMQYVFIFDFDLFENRRSHAYKIGVDETDWINKYFIGKALNQQGEAYGDIYYADLEQTQKDVIIYGASGTIQRDVWNQVLFMTRQDYEQMKASGYAS